MNHPDFAPDTRRLLLLTCTPGLARPCRSAHPNRSAGLALLVLAGLLGISPWSHAQDGGAAAAALKILTAPVAPAVEASPAGLGHAARQSGRNPGASATPTAGTVTVQRGETLDRLIRRSLGETPFSAEFLRKAFVQLNPQAFRASGNPHLISAGSVLRVPTPVQLQQLIDEQYPHWAGLQGAALGETGTGTGAHAHANDAEARKRWVRFP